MTSKPTILFASLMPHRRGGTYWSGFSKSQKVSNLLCNKPSERVLVREVHEGESPVYWAWWNNVEQTFEYVFPSVLMVSTCFQYGAQVETQLGRGKVVGVVVEPAPEEPATKEA